MRLSRHLHFFPAALALATANAQDPGKTAPRTPRPEPALQSLQALTSETIYQRQPLGTAADGKSASASGTASDQRFARIRDARFERDGRLVDLIVELPDEAASPDVVRRLLPAEAATWDEATRRWLTTETTVKFAELTEAPKPMPASEPIARKQSQPLLASQLLLATVKPPAAKRVEAAEPAAEASLTKAARPTTILWFVPSERMLSFAVVPHGTGHLPLPWSLLRVTEQAAGLHLAVESTPARLEDPPRGKDAMEPPSAELRQRCYAHYGVAPPKWDRPSNEVDHQDPLARRNGKSNDR